MEEESQSPGPWGGMPGLRGAKAGSSIWKSPISLQLPLPTHLLWVPGIFVCKRRGSLPVQPAAWVEMTFGSPLCPKPSRV